MPPPWFYRSDDDWSDLCRRLKLTPCPHCHAVGTLNRHGVLRGFTDAGRQTTIRGHRVYCSNRHARPGCGRTVSVWHADTIRRLSLSTRGLWRFLQDAVLGSVRAACQAAADAARRSDRTFQRLWTRFRHAQSTIRSALFSRCPPPDLPATPDVPPAAHVLAHLRAAFPDAPCPIAAFQHAHQAFLI